MIPGMNMNSRQMKQAMKRMGVEQENLDVQEVIFRLPDRDIVFSNPEVAKVNMMGQETFQVVGDYAEQERDTTIEVSEDDVTTVVDQTGVSREEAKAAIIAANGDLAAAILSFQDDDEVE